MNRFEKWLLRRLLRKSLRNTAINMMWELARERYPYHNAFDRHAFFSEQLDDEFQADLGVCDEYRPR